MEYTWMFMDTMYIRSYDEKWGMTTCIYMYTCTHNIIIICRAITKPELSSMEYTWIFMDTMYIRSYDEKWGMTTCIYMYTCTHNNYNNYM